MNTKDSNAALLEKLQAIEKKYTTTKYKMDSLESSYREY